MSQHYRWRDRAEMLLPPLPWDRPHWRNRGGPTVVLLHGLWRGWHAMEPLTRELDRQGFSTLNVPYPSTRLPIPELIQRIRSEVEKIANDEPVHFVTHSLGGIIARAMLADAPSWKSGRLVMLAPPNGGSEIVDWAASHPVIRQFLGPAGRSLGSQGFPSSLPPLPDGLEAAVIMGRRCSIPMFKNLLESDNDGIVSASKGKIEGLRGFTVIDADHTFIQMHPEAIRLTLEFLTTGNWRT
jgi:pimeloyl-ACP methyl ester carboxylesterase